MDVDFHAMQYSEMLPSEQVFLDRLLREKKPKKILEVGVSAGASSVVILNAMKDLPDSKLFSVELSETYYPDLYDESRKDKRLSGFLVKEYFPDVGDKKWRLLTGNVAAAFMEQIGGEVDFVLLDASHCLPGELLDFLMILPFVKTGATVVLHDVNLNYNNAKMQFFLISCRVLFSLVTADGKRLVEPSPGRLPNIGSFEITQKTRDNISDLFQILTIPWWYIPEEEHYQAMLALFKKHYDKKDCDLFVTAYDFQRRNFDQSAPVRNASDAQIAAKGIVSRHMAKRVWKYVPCKRFFRKLLAAMGVVGR